MTIPHLDLQIEYLQAIKAGKRMGWRSSGSEWTNSDFRHPTWNPNVNYELREVTRQQYIPECDVPRALEVEPEDGTEYWTIDPSCSPAVRKLIYYKGAVVCVIRLGNGVCFATESDACAAWEAMTARRERS